MVKRRSRKGKAKKSPSNLVSYGDFRLPPVVPGPEVDDICNRIDDFYRNYPKRHKRQKPSDLIKGAFYAIRPECKSNPDWMSQAANSARDVLYPLFSEGVSSNNLMKLFKKYVANKTDRSKITDKEFVRTFDNLDKIYKQLSDLTHHGTELKGFSEKQFANFSENDFENLLKDFTSILGRAFNLQQIYTHTIIDLIVQKKRRGKGIKNDLRLILNVNFDAHQYFFTKVDEQWLDWLWKNEFLDAIKQKAEDPMRYGYRMPELDYLVRIAEKVPEKVATIILNNSTAASQNNFNHGVVERFTWICGGLPARQLTRLVTKIRDEGWIKLMAGFNSWGFEYEKMLKTLAGAKDYKNILILVDAILAIKSREELNKSKKSYSFDHPFYFNDLSYVNVFSYLANVGNKYSEQALKLSVKIITDIILLTKKEDEDADKKVFDIYDSFLLLDVDFFTLKLGQKDRLSGKDDVRELGVVIKELAEKTIGAYDTDPFKAKELYENYIKPLPDCRSMWRLKLFVLTLYPEYFKEELKESFFRLFTTDRYHEIMSGAEYEKALRKGFSVLDEADQREYIKQTIKYFTKKDQEKENEKENWHIKYGSIILSMVADQLTEQEKVQIKKVGFKLNSSYEPSPSIGPMQVGTIVPRGPITAEEFNRLTTKEISDKLRNDWTPKKLSEQNTPDDFHHPLNAEGVGDLLKKDIPKRLQDYINSANLFFERNSLDQHYTYSFLRGIQEILRNPGDIGIDNIDWINLINLLSAIQKSGESEKFDTEMRERGSFDAWLSGWTGVHSAMADVIQELINEKQGRVLLINFLEHRDALFEILNYLLRYPDPLPKDETEEGGEPFTKAINTVRGRSFQAFAMFVYQDGNKFSKDDKLKISPDVKKLHELVLEDENTRSIMFMFGHYIASFYHRDAEWIHGLLPKIFTDDTDKTDLYLAAWEGYLANNLFKEIFSDPVFTDLYLRAIKLKPEEYTKRQYFKDLDEGLATHLALAYLYFENFGFENALYKEFWKNDNEKRHGHFISFIGRQYISGDDRRSSPEIDKEQIKTRLEKFWDWGLEHHKEPKALAGFGYWMNNSKNIFDYKWLAERIRKTLEETKGDIEWEYALMQTIAKLAEEAPKDTVQILRLYLTNITDPNRQSHGWIYIDREIFDAFKSLYANPITKEEAYILINDLLPLANGQFWKLKEVLKL